MYAPEVRLIGTPTRDVEEGRDNVELRCEADANPPASVVWRRAGRPDILSLEETLPIRPVKRADSGTYTCQARNSVGASQPLSVHLDVKCESRCHHDYVKSTHNKTIKQ
ncbi:hypothetical protein B566_EDAN002719 [Ephemera danica]|nr:hypothetical protein B566_EDAN002719 [Ephemera danica]